MHYFDSQRMSGVLASHFHLLHPLSREAGVFVMGCLVTQRNLIVCLNDTWLADNHVTSPTKVPLAFNHVLVVVWLLNRWTCEVEINTHVQHLMCFGFNGIFLTLITTCQACVLIFLQADIQNSWAQSWQSLVPHQIFSHLQLCGVTLCVKSQRKQTNSDLLINVFRL